jgi:hypothetical protein
MSLLRLFVLCGLMYLLMPLSSLGQQIVLQGRIRDVHSDEPIPFATVRLINTSFVKLSDSAGHFRFVIPRWTGDSLLITYAGFEDATVKLDTTQRRLDLVIGMERGKPTSEVVVKGKINRGLLLWRRIVKNKPLNDRSRFSSFRYELYNKLEIDLNRVNREKMEKGIIPPKPFKFILENIDTSSEENPAISYRNHLGLLFPVRSAKDPRDHQSQQNDRRQERKFLEAPGWDVPEFQCLSEFHTRFRPQLRESAER